MVSTDGKRAFAGLLRPLGELDAAAQDENRRVGKTFRSAERVRLLEAVVGAVVLRAVGADAVKADLGRLAPAAEDRQMAAPVEHPRRDELHLGALVAGDRVAAADVDGVVGADVAAAAHPEREPAARIGAVEEGMPLQRAARDDRVEPLEEPLALVCNVGLRVRLFVGLLLLNQRLA